MLPNDEQQRLYQMFQQMAGPDPYGRMLQVPNSPYYPCWGPPFPQPIMPPPPPNQKFQFPEQLAHEQALQMNQLPPNQSGLNLNGINQGLQNMPPMPMGLPPGFGMPPLGPGQMAQGPFGAGSMGPPPMGGITGMSGIGGMNGMGPGGMQLPGMGPIPQGPIGQMPPFDFQFKQQPPMQSPMNPNQVMAPQQQPIQQQHIPQQQQIQQQQAPSQQPQQQSSGQPNQSNQQNLEQGFSQVVNEFQLKILNMFVMQNQMLLDFKNKNANLENTITSILDEISNLQKIVESKFDNVQADDFMSRLSIPNQEMTQNNILLKSLQCNQSDFQYQLVLTNDLEQPLFKDKNFNLYIALKDMKGMNIKNHNKIELEVQLYSSDDKPVLLISNSQNQAILRQPEDNIWLEEGISNIEKLQINEVTSHYQNGWIYLVVYPIKNDNKIVQNSISPSQIKPLIYKVSVKSKKTQKKSSRSRSRSHERLRRLEKLDDRSSSESENHIQLEIKNLDVNDEIQQEKENDQDGEQKQQQEQQQNNEQKKDEVHQNKESDL
ncbi:unnamed protein product (macronuclear) [Paramecium tetraurelia]|uniref:Uncharacterized protein n=1 Tax=Paramecium tetraurelia TaxID=5888 RepID=A0C9J4_PARTE|nr:uncharacterized protein GSPATT00006767001 [Paramecium tetraurelia]CAK67461.1 unnamed protein product [Paramecium tetraurelia]|eukprot:XP_001434858.1 hypothetical protein (macronuclear) [Paramecium tetraurelia strain d4-2]